MENEQFYAFKDSLARRILALDAVSSSSPGRDSEDDSALDDFSTYLAQEVWISLPLNLRESSHANPAYMSSTISSPDDISVETLPLGSTPSSFLDSLISYGYAIDDEAGIMFLLATLRDYLRVVCAPPLPWSSTRTSECEICERDVPLTYHHLIPRSVHAKARKKGWHTERMINSVAWLCRCVQLRA